MPEPVQDPASITLGRTDLQVSRLGIGAMVWGEMSTAPWWSPARSAYGPTSTASDQREALEVSLAAGVNFLDTAAMYGKGVSERRVGELTKGKDMVLATKFPFGTFSRESSLPATLDESLSRLQRTRIDLYQIHYPFPWMSIPKLMNLMADVVEAGKARAVGVSNYNAKQMRIAHTELAKRGIPLASNQVQYSLLHRQPETDGVLEACRELGVTLIAYMPLASGALTGKYSASTRPAGWRRYGRHFRGKNLVKLGALLELLRQIGDRHGVGPAQVAVRWLIQQNQVLPIVGAKNGTQARQNADALTFTLDVGELDALSAITKPVSSRRKRMPS
jgi:aryl-alcohol dehydrogenase-like predicted oxidoreductase